MYNKEIWIARTYAKSFRDGDWKEAFADQEGNFLPATEERNLNWRTEGLERAYPLITTAEYIRKETQRPDAILITLTDADVTGSSDTKRVRAFGWGYSIDSPDSLVEEKWAQASIEEKAMLAETIANSTGSNPLWYLSEVAVDPKFQGIGLGSQVVSLLLAQAPEDKTIILRTTAKSTMTFIARNNNMIPVIGPAETQAGLIGNLVLDPVNSSRVVFIRPR